MRAIVISAWFAATIVSKLYPGHRYKQTSTQVINAGQPVLDGGGYIVGMNINYDRLGSACTALFTVDRATKGDIFAIGFTRTINVDSGTSTNIQYQSGQSIVSSFVYGNSLFFQGAVVIPSLSLVANKIDIAYVLDMSTKTVKLLVSTVVGGPKTLIAEKPFATTNINSNLIQMYADASPSAVTNILAYNNAEFAL